MRVRWTEPARRHIKAIHAFIAESSPVRAQRVAGRLTLRAEQIGEFPRAGRVVRGLEALEVREVFEASYRIIYVIVRGQVEILGIVHAKRGGP